VRFLSAAASAQFEEAMESAGLSGSTNKSKLMKLFKTDTSRKDRNIHIDSVADSVTIGHITVPRRACALPELVPQPLFHANASHLQVLESLLLSYKASYETGEKAILLIGNQGVGKNKLVDRLLQVRSTFILILCLFLYILGHIDNCFQLKCYFKLLTFTAS
jgi:hypothetical protein